MFSFNKLVHILLYEGSFTLHAAMCGAKQHCVTLGGTIRWCIHTGCIAMCIALHILVPGVTAHWRTVATQQSNATHCIQSERNLNTLIKILRPDW